MLRQAPGSPRAAPGPDETSCEAAVARRLIALGCPVRGAELSFWFELRAPALQGMLWWLARAPLASLERSLSGAELGAARARAAAGKPLLRGAELRRAAAALGVLEGVRPGVRPRRTEASPCGRHLRAELSREAERLVNSNALLSTQVRLLAERRERAEGRAARRAEELLTVQASERDAAEALAAALKQLGRVAAELDQDKQRQGSEPCSGPGSGSTQSCNDAELHAAVAALERELSGHVAADQETVALVDALARAWFAQAQARVDTAALRAQLHLLQRPDCEVSASRQQENLPSVTEQLAEARRVCRMRAQLRPAQLAGNSAGKHRRRADLLAEAAAAREDWLYSLRTACQGAEAAALEEAAMLHEARTLADSHSGADQARHERREGRPPSQAAQPTCPPAGRAAPWDEDRENDGGARGNAAPPPACVKATDPREGRETSGSEPHVPELVRAEAARLSAEASRLARADALLAALERELAHRLLRLEAAAVAVASDVQDLAQRRAACLR
jgi:hypothetical protein